MERFYLYFWQSLIKFCAIKLFYLFIYFLQKPMISFKDLLLFDLFWHVFKRGKYFTKYFNFADI